MTYDVISRLTELLISFKTVGGIEASLVTTRGGVNLASLVPKKTNADALAAMSSALLNAADIMASQVNTGPSDRIVIECQHCKLLVVSAGPKALFVALTNENVNLGALFVKMAITAQKIKEIMQP
jgi:predicted regulator of Ras-like GTPase activity (Roadblock/LC7/MglB family)